jgi:predicted NBD/HSP70 family sugar kinase
MSIAHPATPSTARAINDRLALHLLLDQGPQTATQVKVHTGLSRPTVADLLERLQQAGLVTVVGEAGEQRRGPNARLYGLAADRAHIAGVDVRTVGVAVAVADLTGRIRETAELPANPGIPPARLIDDTVQALARASHRAGAEALHTIAVGAPGLVDPATGELSPTGGLPRWHSDLVHALRERFGGAVLLENEVNLAGIAEQRLGAARDRDTFVLLWLGHGVGAAAVLDGRLRRGASGGTGEIGFLPVPGTHALPTATGAEGGFHSLAASAAVCALAREHGFDVPAADDAPAAEAAIRTALAAGSAGAACLDRLAARIAVGAAALCVILDPGCLVLGGEIGRAGGTALAERVSEHLAAHSPLRTEVRPGSVEGSAVLQGAVLTAMDTVHRDLFGGP